MGVLPAPERAVRGAAQILAVLALVLASLAAPRPALAASSLPAGDVAFDVSFPECRDLSSIPAAGFAIVGVTGGRAFTRNRCFVDLYRLVSASGQTPQLYLNVNYPNGPTSSKGSTGPRGHCAPNDAPCQAYNYGYADAQDAVSFARSVGISAAMWWLDVETANHWSPNPSLNAEVIRGAIDYFNAEDISVGIYSIARMWHQIAGNFAPGVPNWVAQTHLSIPPPAYCSAQYAFGQGTIWMVQYWDGRHDVDYVCGSAPAAAPPAGSQPMPLGSSATGSIRGSSGGSSQSFAFDYGGNDSPESITVTFWPHGPDVAGAFFASLYLNGALLAKVQGMDTPTPGQLHLSLTSRASGQAVVELTSYNDPAATPPISYSIQR